MRLFICTCKIWFALALSFPLIYFWLLKLHAIDPKIGPPIEHTKRNVHFVHLFLIKRSRCVPVDLIPINYTTNGW